MNDDFTTKANQIFGDSLGIATRPEMLANSVPQQRQEKHIALYQAIESIREINKRLERLSDKICGGVDEADQKQPETPIPSLVRLLEYGADSIHEQVKEAIGRIDAIESELF